MARRRRGRCQRRHPAIAPMAGCSVIGSWGNQTNGQRAGGQTLVSQNESLTKDQATIADYRQNLVYQADVLVYGDVTISFSAMEVRRGGQLVALARKEFKTLAYFLQNARRVISRDELLNQE